MARFRFGNPIELFNLRPRQRSGMSSELPTLDQVRGPSDLPSVTVQSNDRQRAIQAFEARPLLHVEEPEGELELWGRGQDRGVDPSTRSQEDANRGYLGAD